jgi:hypothetical protein
MTSTNTSSSVARTGLKTGLKAGATFLGTMVIGLVLALLIGGSVTWLYWSHFVNLAAMGGAHAGHAGGIAVLIVFILLLIANPNLLVGIILPFFILLYGFLSFFYAWRRALQRVVETHSDAIADRLAGTVSNRLAAMPRTQDTLRRAGQWLSEDGISQTLETLNLGGRSWTRRIARFAIKRLPWSDLLSDWATGAEGKTEADSERFRSVLAPRISTALRETTTPSWVPLILCLLAHAALFGLGAWFAG